MSFICSLILVGRQLPGRDRLRLIGTPGQDPDPNQIPDPDPDPGLKKQMKVNLQRVDMHHPVMFPLIIQAHNRSGKRPCQRQNHHMILQHSLMQNPSHLRNKKGMLLTLTS